MAVATHRQDRTRWVLAISRHTAVGVATLLALVCCFVALAPSINLLPGISLYDSKRLVQLGLVLAASASLVLVAHWREGWLRLFAVLPIQARWLLGVVLLIGVTSALNADVPGTALLDVGFYLLLFVLTLLLAHTSAVHGEWYEKLAVATVAASVLFYSVSFAVGYALQFVVGGVGVWPESYVGFSHIRFLNQFQAWTLPLIVLAPTVLDVSGKSIRACLAGLGIAWWMLLLASGGRGATLGMLAAFAFVAVVFRARALPWLRLQLVSLGGGAVLFVFLFQVLADTRFSIIERAANASDVGRIDQWFTALAVAIERPLLGLGPMHSAYHPNGLWPTSHNAVVQIVVEWGFPVAVIVVALVAFALFAWVRQSGSEMGSGLPLTNSLVRVALTASIVAAGVHSMFSGVTIMPLSQTMMVIVVGWAMGLYWKERGGALDESPSVYKQWILGVAVAMAMVIVVAGSYQEAFATIDMKTEWFEHSGQLKLSPRFWHQGFFGY